MRSFILTASTLLLAAAAFGQTSLANRPFIRASGEGVVSIRPDQLKINVGVTTQARTAQEAVDANATRVTEVLNALRQLLGANADIKTVNYSVSPNYRYPTGGGQPEITGYTATNTSEVTSSDLTLAGRIIDVATQAGASTVTGLRFGLKDPDPARREALRQATQQARSHAEAIAQGLNSRLGAVLAAAEGFTTRLVGTTAEDRGAATAATTPIETGTLEVRAVVTLELEIAQ
jgi:uncharacterized protein YggE